MVALEVLNFPVGMGVRYFFCLTLYILLKSERGEASDQIQSLIPLWFLCVLALLSVPESWYSCYDTYRDKKHVHVSVYDRTRPGVVIVIRVFNAATGGFVSERIP